METKSIRFIKQSDSDRISGYAIGYGVQLNGMVIGVVARALGSKRVWSWFPGQDRNHGNGATGVLQTTRAAATDILIAHVQDANEKAAEVSKGGPKLHQCQTGDPGCMHDSKGNMVKGPGVAPVLMRNPYQTLPTAPRYADACIDCGAPLKASTPHVGDRCGSCYRALEADSAPKGPKGGGALVTLLAFGLAFVGAFSVGACSGLQTRPTDPYAAIQARQMASASAATDAIRAAHASDDDGDAARAAAEDAANAEQAYCGPAYPASAVPLDSGCDCASDDSKADHTCDETCGQPAQERWAPTHRKPLPVGAETILAACPVAFKVMDEGASFRYYCAATNTEVLILKRQPDAGLSAGTIGNPSAAWVR